MTQELLDGADVVALFQKVGGERVSKRLAGCRFGTPRFEPSLFNGLLENRFVNVMTATFSCGPIDRVA